MLLGLGQTWWDWDQIIQHAFFLSCYVMCNLITCDGNLKLLNKTPQKGNTKYRAVNVTDMQSWWALGLILEEQISSMGRGLSGYQVRHEVPQGYCGQMAAIFVPVVHSEGQSENSSPPAWLLWCVLDKTCTNGTATQPQGWICRWDQQYFFLRLWLFYRHQPAKVPKVFMKLVAWTIKITWIWAEWLWIEEQRTVVREGKQPT